MKMHVGAGLVPAQQCILSDLPKIIVNLLIFES